MKGGGITQRSILIQNYKRLALEWEILEKPLKTRRTMKTRDIQNLILDIEYTIRTYKDRYKILFNLTKDFQKLTIDYNKILYEKERGFNVEKFIKEVAPYKRVKITKINTLIQKRKRDIVKEKSKIRVIQETKRLHKGDFDYKMYGELIETQTKITRDKKQSVFPHFLTNNICYLSREPIKEAPLKTQLQNLMTQIPKHINKYMKIKGSSRNDLVQIRYRCEIFDGRNPKNRWNKDIQSILVRIWNFKTLWNYMKKQIELEKAKATQSDNYFTIVLRTLEIEYIREPKGGGENHYTRSIKIDDLYCINIKSENNNCWFSCLNYLKSKKNILMKFGEKFRPYRLINNKRYYRKKRLNYTNFGDNLIKDIREYYNLDFQEPISISKALTIIQDFKLDVKIYTDKNIKSMLNIDEIVEIKDCNMRPKRDIYFTEGHYYIFHRCKKESYKTTYQNYKLITPRKKKLNNKSIFITDYDLETYDKDLEDNKKYVKLSIGGFIDDENKIRYFENLNIMIDYFCKLRKYDIVYLNAFNGSNFDCYGFLIDCMLKRGNIDIIDFMNFNNSIYKFGFKVRGYKTTFITWDLCKFTIGTLRQNLIDFGCNILKGEFDYDKLNKWSLMSVEDKKECKIYLDSDIRGLQELRLKIEKEDTKKIYGCVSRGQLVYNNWLDTLITHNNKGCINEITKLIFEFSNDELYNIVDIPKDISNLIGGFLETKDEKKQKTKIIKKILKDNDKNKTDSIDYKYKIYANWEKTENEIRESIYGGRKYPTQKYYKSKIYDDIINKSYMKNDTIFTKYDFWSNYKKILLYSLFYVDVVSLYPFVMSIFKYPLGKAKIFKKKNKAIIKKILKGEYLAICYISYIPNRDLLQSVLPRRNDKNRLLWDLEKHSGWYCSQDILNALEYDYKIEIQYGYYWCEKDYVLKEYTDREFKKKQNTDKKLEPAKYQIAKYNINSLYGKTGQKSIFNENYFTIFEDDKKDKIISDVFKFYTNHKNNKITEIGRLIEMKGDIKEGDRRRENKINKPSHINSMILANSRKIMYKNYISCNPSQDYKKMMYYTDTDCIITHTQNIIQNKIKIGKNLGDLDNDLDKNCYVIFGIFISPKLYYLEYITPQNEIKTHIRAKGVSKYYKDENKILTRNLTKEDFIKMNNGEKIEVKRDFQFKKVKFDRTKEETKKDIAPYTLIKLINLTKTINKSQFDRRELYENQYYLPHNYNKSKLIMTI